MKMVSAEDAFVLHDRYGLLIEIVEEIAAERGFAVDRMGFDLLMAAKREQSRRTSKF